MNIKDPVQSAASAVRAGIRVGESARITFRHYYAVARWQAKQTDPWADDFAQSKATRRALKAV